MLLQHIVETLDAELDRLLELRTIVSGLNGSLEVTADETDPVIDEIASDEPVPDQTAVVVTKTARRTRIVPTGPRVRAAKVAEKAKALSGSIPVTPVVVSAAALAKEHATKREMKAAVADLTPKLPKGSLGSMIRALRLDGRA